MHRSRIGHQFWSYGLDCMVYAIMRGTCTVCRPRQSIHATSLVPSGQHTLEGLEKIMQPSTATQHWCKNLEAWKHWISTELQEQRQLCPSLSRMQQAHSPVHIHLMYRLLHEAPMPQSYQHTHNSGPVTSTTKLSPSIVAASWSLGAPASPLMCPACSGSAAGPLAPCQQRCPPTRMGKQTRSKSAVKVRATSR